MKTLFYNAKILNVEKSKLVQGEVLVQDEQIVYVGKNAPRQDIDRMIDVKNNILMPGFVNCHAHTPMTLLRGVKDDANLDDWLFNNILPKEQKLTPKDIYYGELLGIMECIKAGITCLDEFYFYGKEIIDALNKTKMRARVGIDGEKTCENMSITQSLNSTLKYMSLHNKNNLLKPVCTAHSIYTLNENQLNEFTNFAHKNNLPLAIHLAETLDEVGKCSATFDKTPAEYLESLGWLDTKLLCFHCVHMDKDDLSLLKSYDVDIATCPSSNIKLASGIAPVFAMQKQGLNVCIGTDGVASNNSLDMFKEMFLVATLSKVSISSADVVPVSEVLKMATINGAKALGYNVGEIKAGKLADIILVDTTGLHWQPIDNAFSHLVYSAKSSDVYLTMINGEILYENGKFNLPINEKSVITNVNKIFKRIK